ncbi:MAG TPA: hypothetical protein VHI98_25500 [Vicinamibacterales bacterium]|nr:hypothetical protein [Vicinamibacterales bacterium]
MGGARHFSEHCIDITDRKSIGLPSAAESKGRNERLLQRRVLGAKQLGGMDVVGDVAEANELEESKRRPSLVSLERLAPVITGRSDEELVRDRAFSEFVPLPSAAYLESCALGNADCGQGVNQRLVEPEDGRERERQGDVDDSVADSSPRLVKVSAHVDRDAGFQLTVKEQIECSQDVALAGSVGADERGQRARVA